MANEYYDPRSAIEDYEFDPFEVTDVDRLRYLQEEAAAARGPAPEIEPRPFAGFDPFEEPSDSNPYSF